MAVTVYETQETRGFSEASGKINASRKFFVWDDGSAITEPATIRAQFGLLLPDIGDLFPGETDIYAISYDIRHLPDSRNAWEVEFRYENTEPGDTQPQEPGYTEITVDYAAEFRDFFRVYPNLNIPTNGTPTTADIQGTPIDVAGEPMSFPARLSTVNITETVEGDLASRSIPIREARGRRNSTPFLGAPIGQVLYLGATASRIAVNKFQIQHKFSQDEYCHMLQQPRRDPQRNVELYRYQGVLRANYVTWVQPFPSFYNFDLLSENF